MPAHKKPTKLKKLQGTYRTDRDGKNEPDPEVQIPRKPTWMKGEAAKEWKRITPQLAELGLISELDLVALTAYCSNWALFIECEQTILERGLTFETPNGHTQQRPEVSIRRQALEQAKSFLTEFGLTPASRSKISLPEKKKVASNPFSEIGRN